VMDFVYHIGRLWSLKWPGLLYNELEKYMDFLLDPNVAYLLLMGGVLMVMMALVTPGTGLFEVGAFFCIALTGYEIYKLSFNWWALILIALSIAPFLYSIQKPKREQYLGVSLVILVLGSIFLFPSKNGGPSVNPFVAIAASASVAGFVWIAVGKSIQAAQAKPAHDLGALVGQIGEARTPILEDGSVQVGGELWTARSEKAIPAGSPVRVIGRDGFVVVVAKKDS
jgi:membrane-bound serine protease (ClpP class)